MLQDLNKNLIPLAIVIAGLLIGGAYFFTNQETIQSLSLQEAADKAINFINQSIEEDVTASLLDVTEEDGLYKVHLKIGTVEYNSYITKDGKLLFPNAFNLEEQTEEGPEETSQGESQEQPASLEDFAKCLAEKGAKLYGSSGCGYCQQQKEMFGDAQEYLPYIECADEKTRHLCEEAEIGPVPAWDFPDGERALGLQSFKQLAELSGCSY